nr:NADH-plastoquinone oxidoreductase subunit 5 [Bolbitis x multipinna]UQV94804.1 NADH-plastoquinone oxidoreductase subunit 5 [Bolbitis x multipinna]
MRRILQAPGIGPFCNLGKRRNLSLTND